MELIEVRQNCVLEMTEDEQREFIDAYVGNICDLQHSNKEKIVGDAFLEHFGFPIQDVQDKEELEHIIVLGDPVESFRYRGETFLLWQKGHLDCHIEKSGDYEVTIESKFKKI